MVEYRVGMSAKRLAAGFLAGTLLVTALDAVTFSILPMGDLLGGASLAVTDTVLVGAAFLAWAAAAVGIGALAGWIAGRLEVLVALCAGVAGIALLVILSPLTGTPRWSVVPDVGFEAFFFGFPLLMLIIISGALAFFRRRPELR
jgi:hypothetical protein